MTNLLKTLWLLALTLVLATPACDNRRQNGYTSNTTTGNNGDGIVEGTINGGGGKGVLCPKKRLALEVLDLYEAQGKGLKLIESPKTEEEALTLAVELLSRQLWNPDTIPMDDYRTMLKKYLKDKWLTKIVFLDGTKRLRLINDSHEIIREPGCRSVQIAAYLEDSLYIVREFWNMLSPLHKAALLIHELIYFLERKNGQTNSITSRVLTGQLFSTKGARPRADGLPDRSKLVTCHLRDGEKSNGYVYVHDITDDGEDKAEIVFNSIKDGSVVMRTSAKIPELKAVDLLEMKKQQSYAGEIETESLAEKNGFELTLDKIAPPKLTLYQKDSQLMGSFTMDCGKDNYSATGAREREQIAQPVPTPPTQVEFRSRYEGHGDYQSTATYSFRYMTHDVKVTNGAWDVLFEARSDITDHFRVGLAGNDRGTVTALKSATTSCRDADPCEIKELLEKPKSDKIETSEVKAHQCYLVNSTTSWGNVKVLFEVLEHKKSESAQIGRIQVLTDSNLPICRR